MAISCLNSYIDVLVLFPVSHRYLVRKGGGTEEEIETGDHLLWETCATCSLCYFKEHSGDYFFFFFFAAQTDTKRLEINMRRKQ